MRRRAADRAVRHGKEEEQTRVALRATEAARWTPGLVGCDVSTWPRGWDPFGPAVGMATGTGGPSLLYHTSWETSV